MRGKLLLAGAVLACAGSLAGASEIRVTITNVQPAGGVFLTPFFVATHDGVYDFFNLGQPASMSVERLAEDGTTGPRIAAALATGRVAQALATGGGPIAPGESRSLVFNVDNANPNTRFLGFMSMVIPSNDAFVGNNNPQLLPLFDAQGNILERVGGNAFVIFGSNVYDSGTEVNDEVPANTAFLAQMAPDTGVAENGVVGLHPGFIGSLGLGGGAPGNILQGFPNGDFTVPGARIATIAIQNNTQVPEPSTLAAFLTGGLVLLGRRWLR